MQLNTFYIKGKILSGFWSLTTLVFIMFYGSNLRQQIILPAFDPEINADSDIFEHDVQAIHSGVPTSEIDAWYANIQVNYPEWYARVSISSIVFSFCETNHYFVCDLVSRCPRRLLWIWNWSLWGHIQQKRCSTYDCLRCKKPAQLLQQANVWLWSQQRKSIFQQSAGDLNYISWVSITFHALVLLFLLHRKFYSVVGIKIYFM